jgi:hypothetical protein
MFKFVLCYKVLKGVIIGYNKVDFGRVLAKVIHSAINLSADRVRCSSFK